MGRMEGIFCGSANFLSRFCMAAGNRGGVVWILFRPFEAGVSLVFGIDMENAKGKARLAGSGCKRCNGRLL